MGGFMHGDRGEQRDSAGHIGGKQVPIHAMSLPFRPRRTAGAFCGVNFIQRILYDTIFRWEHKYADAVCIPGSWDIAFPSKTKHLQTVPCSEERRAVYLFYEFARSRQTRLDLTKEEKQCQNAQNSRCLSILISQMKSESRCFNSTKTLSMPEKPMKVLLRIAMISIS